MPRFDQGDTVAWNWGSGPAPGTVQESFAERVTRTSEGTDGHTRRRRPRVPR